MSRVSDLLDAYGTELARTWRTGLAGAERVWMLVYPPDLERAMRSALPRFELATAEAGHGWTEIDLTDDFGRWVVRHRYAEAFFEEPRDLSAAILDRFESDLVSGLRQRLSEASVSDVVVLIGIGSIFPYLRASSVIKGIDEKLNGRLLVLFPGFHDPETHSFRLLDARDGFNYRARVIDPQKDIT